MAMASIFIRVGFRVQSGTTAITTSADSTSPTLEMVDCDLIDVEPDRAAVLPDRDIKLPTRARLVATRPRQPVRCRFSKRRRRLPYWTIWSGIRPQKR